MEGVVEPWLPRTVGRGMALGLWRTQRVYRIALAKSVGLFGVSSAIVVLDESVAVHRHGIRSEKVIEVIFLGSAFVAICRWLPCITRDLCQRIVIQWRRLCLGSKQSLVLVRHKIFPYEKLAIVVCVPIKCSPLQMHLLMPCQRNEETEHNKERKKELRRRV